MAMMITNHKYPSVMLARRSDPGVDQVAECSITAPGQAPRKLQSEASVSLQDIAEGSQVVSSCFSKIENVNSFIFKHRPGKYRKTKLVFIFQKCGIF